MTRYFLCGIGGSGMMPLARILVALGHEVSGSDRSRDRGQVAEKFRQLEQSGIKLFPQDGSGPATGADVLVVSSAIEESVPDVRAARQHNLQIVRRAELLTQIVNGKRGIAVGGTSGKSTVTGMIAAICIHAGLDPWVMNGGVMNGLGSALTGGKDLFVTEADESDGSIALYRPAISVLTNITHDHKPVEELRPLFHDFLACAAEGAVVNLDDPESASMAHVNPHTLTFSLKEASADILASDIHLRPGGASFSVQGAAFNSNVPGLHNVSNALAAIAVARILGIPTDQAAGGLNRFNGIARRLQTVGEAEGVTVIDDFAHNPDKIRASLTALRDFPGRLWIVFQPHGYGPLRMMMEGLAESFSHGLDTDDRLLLLPVHDAGGTADRSVSSRDLAAKVGNAQTFESRAQAAAFLQSATKPGDRVVVMGARDDTLSEFARGLLESFKGRISSQ